MQFIMENIKTCELCLEQIIKTEDFENLNYDKKQNLTILKNLEITVSRDANICSNCVNVSHLTYNFKMSCLTNNDHLKTLIHPGINDKLILEDVVVEKTKKEFENEEKVCRFCLNFSKVNSLVEVNLEQDVILKDMLERCLPEIDINIVQNPLICSICSELLKKLLNFISQSKHTEAFSNLVTKTDSLDNENKQTVTIENNDNNINESFLKEENCEGLEDSELQIKSEDSNIDEHIKDSINDSTQTHRKSRKSTKNKSNKCSECLFQFKRLCELVKHKKKLKKANECNICGFMASNKCDTLKHSREVHQNLTGPDLFKCHKCPYITKWKKILVVHNMRWHVDISKRPKYKCDECPYETVWKYILPSHKLIHRDSSEVKMHKCMKCLFQTKSKSSLRRHEKRHARKRQKPVKVKQSLNNSVRRKYLRTKPGDTTNEKKFVCDICSYQADKSYTLRQHNLIHKKPSEVNLFKCNYCRFATKWKSSLTAHTKRHKNPLEFPKFKCNDCPFETHDRSNLGRHFLVHRDPSKVNMYKCKVCSFQTKHKGGFQTHEEKHQVEIYTCDECNYETKLAKSFMAHLRCHREWKKLAKKYATEKKHLYVRLERINYTTI